MRDALNNKEVSLKTLELLQSPHDADEGVLRKILLGLSCRDYEACAEAVPEAFGLSASTISRRFIQASSRKLRELMERDLSEHDFVVLFIDGKSFAEDEMIIALGITLDGEKVILGFVQSGTENERVIKGFLNSLIDRGLNVDKGLLCVIPAWRQTWMEARDYILGLKGYSETRYSSNAANGTRERTW